MKWIIHGEVTAQDANSRLMEIYRALLVRRGVGDNEVFKEFVNPKAPEAWSLEEVGIDAKEVEKAVMLLEKIRGKKSVLVYGDYDADGVTATTIMWDVLEAAGFAVVPFVPNRRVDGYGMKPERLKALLKEHPEVGLVVTVDQGIVAHEAADFLRKKKIPVIVTDHHQRDGKELDVDAIVHTTKTSGSGVAWLLGNHLRKSWELKTEAMMATLELAVIGTVADLLPLSGFNRSLVWHGLKRLQKTQRRGLKAMLDLAKINQSVLDTYHVGYMLAPRINAMGRLTSADVALQLLKGSAEEGQLRAWADVLESTNKERQLLTEDLVTRAILEVKNPGKLIVLVGKDYDEGIIGLVAGKLVEKFHKPSIVVSLLEGVAKASARSVRGFNMVEFLRESVALLEAVGGHEAAAGFSVNPENLELLKLELEKKAEVAITDDMLEQSLEIDCVVDLQDLTWNLWDRLNSLAPFGSGNPRPMLASKDVRVLQAGTVGSDGQHLKLKLGSNSGGIHEAIWFGMGNQFEMGTLARKKVHVAYQLSENIWNNTRRLDLHVKDLVISDD